MATVSTYTGTIVQPSNITEAERKAIELECNSKYGPNSPHAFVMGGQWNLDMCIHDSMQELSKRKATPPARIIVQPTPIPTITLTSSGPMTVLENSAQIQAFLSQMQPSQQAANPSSSNTSPANNAGTQTNLVPLDPPVEPKDNTGLIIGLAAGGVVLTIGAMVAIKLIKKRKKQVKEAA